MLGHEFFRKSTVMRRHGFEYRPVFPYRRLGTAGFLYRQLARLLDIPVKIRQCHLQHAAAARLVDKLVEARVELPYLHHIAALGVEFLQFDDAAQRAELRVGDVLGRPARREALYIHPYGINVGDVLLGNSDDHRAAIRNSAHETLQLELAERFAYRRPADPELVAELLFGQGVARSENAV
jgi:hypothetical protein